MRASESGELSALSERLLGSLGTCGRRERVPSLIMLQLLSPSSVEGVWLATRPAGRVKAFLPTSGEELGSGPPSSTRDGVGGVACVRKGTGTRDCHGAPLTLTGRRGSSTVLGVARHPEISMLESGDEGGEDEWADMAVNSGTSVRQW